MKTRARTHARAWRAAAGAGLTAALIMIAGCSGGDPASSAAPTAPTPTATPNNTPSPSPFSIQMAATGGECRATRTDPVSCNFEARPSGGQGPYTYTWTFTTPDATVTMTGATVKPVLGCRFSGSAPTFDVDITLRAEQTGGPAATAANNQTIIRVPGDC